MLLRPTPATTPKALFLICLGGGETFKDEITHALALQLNLTTTQRANEKALAELAKTSGKTAGLKEAIQARAALYGELLDPS